MLAGNKNFFIVLLILFIFSSLTAVGDKFYNYYDDGLEYMEKGDWERALSEFKSAYSLQFADKNRKRLYGTRFIRYFPHREAGICYYFLNEYDNARNELEISISYYNSDKAMEYLVKMRKGITPDDIAREIEEKKKEEEKLREEEKAKEFALKEAEKRISEEKEREIKNEIVKEEAIEEKSDVKPINVDKKVRTPLISEQPKITRVGSPLSIAVLPFENSDGKIDASIVSVAMDKLITQLVKTRRFKIIERGAIEKIMAEQSLSMTGIVDEETAVETGKIIGADAIIVGNMSYIDEVIKINVRLIDVETSETIVANDVDAYNNNIARSMQKMAQMIFNDMPLVQGIIIKADADRLYIDIGSNLGIRKGTKCIVYEKGEEIVHPITGEILGNNVTVLGEVVIVQVQNKLSISRITKQGHFDIGNVVSVK